MTRFMTRFMTRYSYYKFRNFVKAKICQVHDAIEYSTKHPFTQLKKEANESTLDYIKATCPRAVGCRSPRQLIDLALQNVSVDGGLYLEFGVFKGHSIRYLGQKLPNKVIHGFDSFEGLPEAWADHAKGAFTREGKLPNVQDNVQLCKGYFDNTLPDWVSTNKGDIAFIHIDCDLKSSTQTIFEFLADRMVPGTVIVFDDYFNFPSWQEDGHAVFNDFIKEKGWKINYLGYAFKELAVQIA